MTVREFYARLEKRYPRELSAPWDNDGLMCCADPGAEVKKVLLSLDATAQAVERAAAGDFDVLLTHHPMIFRGVRSFVGGEFPADRVLVEDQSRNTEQNMEFSKKLIEERDGSADDKNVIFVTTNYHVFRSGVWAGLAGLRAEGLGSETKWWFWPNAFIRECIGLLANRIVPEVIWLVILVAIFGGIATLIV